MKRKSKVVSIFACVLCIGMLFGTVAFANVGTITLYLPSSQVVAYIDNVTRSGCFSYVSTHLNSVSPTNGGVDNFTKVRSAIYTTGHTRISDTYTLNETNSNNTYMEVWEGYYNLTTVSLGYWGNNPNYAANAIIYYNGF